ncbi:MAG: DNA polymerase III subunit beta [Candidatus Eremiobacteraeota bacterium]|nr:DNA polymerase III subunit beta [Candidatus Eremiobacteraeota bacterium]MBC5828283.1 DNA polymerase III subunit beta [Candidatus Eremiobacteraeota bacterium]
MKFTCNSKDIAGAVTAASKVVNAHSTMPILGNVLLSAKDGRVAVRATDLELTLENGFSADIEEEGTCTVPARLFSGYLANLPASALEMHGTPTRAALKCDRSNYEFFALPPEEYPPLPDGKEGDSFRIDAKAFRDAVNSVTFAASNEEARGAVLMGTLLEIEGQTLTLVATDGYRLARYEVALSEPAAAPARLIVPARALAEVVRIGASGTIEATVLGGQANQLVFKAGDVKVVARLVDGQYPNYSQVIPKDFERKVVAATARLLASLRRAEVVAGDRASMVKLAMDGTSLVITATSDTAGNAYEELDVERTGDPLTIAFNAKYLVEILNHINAETVSLEFVGALNPTALRPAGGENASRQFYILMPLRQ